MCQYQYARSMQYPRKWCICTRRKSSACLQLIVAQVEHFDRVVRLEQHRDLRAVRRQHLVVRQVELVQVHVRAQRRNCTAEQRSAILILILIISASGSRVQCSYSEPVVLFRVSRSRDSYVYLTISAKLAVSHSYTASGARAIQAEEGRGSLEFVRPTRQALYE